MEDFTINFNQFTIQPRRLRLWNMLAEPLQISTTPRNKCSGHETKQSDGEVPVQPIHHIAQSAGIVEYTALKSTLTWIGSTW